MANPQKENGYTSIANEILERLAAIEISLSHYEWKCLMLLFRKTYGWQKKVDRISLSQFSEGTGIPKPHVCRAMKKLTKKKIVTQTGNGYYVSYSFQKDHDLWIPLPKQAMPVTQTGNEPLPKQVDTKYNKETITKENQPDKPAQFSKEFKEKAEKAKAFGFNIYQMIGSFYKQSKLSEKLPEYVLGSVLDEVLIRHQQIKDPFPYFLKVLEDKSARYFSQKNQKEGEALKKESIAIKDILASMSKTLKLKECSTL